MDKNRFGTTLLKKIFFKFKNFLKKKIENLGSFFY